MASMAEPTSVYARQAARLNEAILALEDGAASALVGPQTRTAAELPTMYGELQLAVVRAAIEAILTGAQAYTLLGRTFQKASLAELRAERDLLERRYDPTVSSSSGGIRLRQAVPVQS